MYQILQKFDIHWHDGGPSIAMMCHLRRVSDLLYNWKSCLLCYMKDVVLHCFIFFKWNKLVRVRVRESSPTNARYWAAFVGSVPDLWSSVVIEMLYMYLVLCIIRPCYNGTRVHIKTPSISYLSWITNVVMFVPWLFKLYDWSGHLSGWYYQITQQLLKYL